MESFKTELMTLNQLVDELPFGRTWVLEQTAKGLFKPIKAGTAKNARLIFRRSQVWEAIQKMPETAAKEGR